MRKHELLSPAGSLEICKAVLNAGADAVYLGGDKFGARAFAKNFTQNDIQEALDFAHMRGKKIFLTVNTLLKNKEIETELFSYLKPLYEHGLDAVIVQDYGVFQFVHRNFPELALHASTQMSVSNVSGAKFLVEHGAERIVTARELSRSEIRRIYDETGVEIESFIHGAMCISYSGRCLLSNFFTGRDANQGACTHPCRWKYSVVEETRPGEYMPVYENERGTYIFNSKDLCMIEHIPEMIDAGIDSFKIEGRMKTALYVATVARTYRKAIDDYLEDPKKYEANMPWYRDQISNCTYRQFTTGFYFGKPGDESQIYDSNTYIKEYTYLGIIGGIKDGMYRIEQRNKFSVGETVEIMKPDGQNVEVTVEKIVDEDGQEQESAPHPKQVLYVALSGEASVYDILRRQEGVTE